MGVRIVGDMQHFSPAQAPFFGLSGIRPQQPLGSVYSRPSSTPKFEVHYDGTGGKEGLPSALAANEAWLDPTYLKEPGTQLGVSACYYGGSTCELFGCFLPSDLAHKVATAEGPNLVTLATAKWQSIAVLAPNVPINVQEVDAGIMYTLYRLVFASGAGSVILTSR